MKTTIRTTIPMDQKISVTSNYHKDWNAYLVNIYSEESYPTQPDRRPIGEEVTLSFNAKADVERFIELIRKATRKMK